MPSSPKTNSSRRNKSRSRPNTDGNKLTGEDIVSVGVAIEEVGRQLYLDGAKTARNPDIKQLFLDLAAEEQQHIAAFKQITAEAFGSAGDKTAASRRHIKTLLMSNAFLDSDKVNDMLQDAEEHGAAVMLAIRFEKEVVLLLYSMKEFVREQDLHIVNELISEEKQHIERLSRYLQKAEGDSSLCP